jgi:hypothetical protein
MLDDRIAKADDEVSLVPILRTLWAYRRAIAVLLFIVVVGMAATVMVMYARVPVERLATLGFQLTFEGAEQRRFPNGTRFSPAEIVGSPVLSEVFRQNELERYAPYADFKQGMFVVEADPELQLLSYDYQSRLADPRLSPPDRARIEDEFRNKRESLKSAQFTLNVRASGRLGPIPDSLFSKVLQDTLSTWAAQAAERKGALRYDIPIVSKNIVNKGLVSAEEPVVAVDMLRNTVVRMLQAVSDIAKLPGAAALRITEQQASLEDIRVNLENILRFKVEPLVAVISAAGVADSGPQLDVYFQGRVLASQLERAAAERRIKTLQDALQAYQLRSASQPRNATDGAGGTLTPQLSESIIDRLLATSTQSADMAYRQELTNRIIEAGLSVAELNKQAEYYASMRRTLGAGQRFSPKVMGEEVGRRTDQILADIGAGMDQIHAFSKLLSEQNLNPNTVLYTITTPVVVREHQEVNARAMVLFFSAALLVALIAVPLGCLAHAYFVERVAPRRRLVRKASESPDGAAGV